MLTFVNMVTAVTGGTVQLNTKISKDDTTPIVMVIPGLTSDSTSPYLKHLAFNIAKHGWNVVVGNHRGLGGTSITSDCFYNAGWTEDARVIINYLRQEYPEAPLYVVGTSIGANVLVKYLGEDGENVPIAGAVAICSPWDLLIGDRFINRKLRQKVYDRALTIGLQGYAQLHQPQYSRLADWEGIKKSRSIRDFDNYATCIVGKFETVDTYYRRCSSASYVSKVSVPLLCVSALDDPVCTREAIPWDECRANKNIVLATTQHGGHLAFFEGITAKNLWWVRATVEFLSVLHSSPHVHHPKKILETGHHSLPDSSIDQGPFVNVGGDGLVAAVGSEHTTNNSEEDTHNLQNQNASLSEHASEPKTAIIPETAQHSNQPESGVSNLSPASSSPVKRRLNELISRHSNLSIWLLAYIAITTSWPVVGSIIKMFYGRKIRNAPMSAGINR
uniref:AB hydrolase-1 domain-containing protein n=1 Tax=Kalanchoe fedtschenkoi TaxID=63787 RepID=A0A7N0REQ7_KALFE